MPVQADLKSSSDSTISIGELASATGHSTSAIRYYEERGLVFPIRRDGGRRRFERTAIRRLGLIDLCTAAGFSLDECALLLTDRDATRASSRELGEAKLIDIDEQMARLELARKIVEFGLACTCPTLEECSCGAGLAGIVPAETIRPGRVRPR